MTNNPAIRSFSSRVSSVAAPDRIAWTCPVPVFSYPSSLSGGNDIHLPDLQELDKELHRRIGFPVLGLDRSHICRTAFLAL